MDNMEKANIQKLRKASCKNSNLLLNTNKDKL